MKMIKKLATLVLAVCLIVPCFSILTHAANGQIQFTDPSAKAGETVEVVGKVKRTDGTGFGKVEITMTYDTTFLKFKGGDGFTESTAGTIVYVGDATNETGREHAFTMQFDALKAGTTKLTITVATVKSVAGAALDYTKGNSTITIAEGEGTTTVDTSNETTDNEGISDVTGTVEIDGVSYTIANEFPENEIPKGYEAATLDYDMATYNVVYSESNGIYLAYLVGTDNVGKFFMYVEEDATFAPFEQVSISDDTTIILLSDVSEIVLPEEYAEIVLTMNGQKFPAWNNTSNSDYYVLYAMNQNGEVSLYQYDSIEKTYQRFEAPEVVTDDGANKGFIATLTNLLENHLDYVILGTGLGFILFILIIVILGVKLYNRNAELDEIYDEYGIDSDEDDTDDDVILDLNGDDDYDDEDDEEDEVNDDMAFLVREGMREVFPEVEEEEVEEEKVQVEAEVEEPVETEKESLDELVNKNVAASVAQPKESVQEDTLAQVLAKQKEADKEVKDDYLDDEEDFLENFSMDFIDLDD